MGSFDPTVSSVKVPIWPVPYRSDERNLQFTISYIILVSAWYYAFVFSPFLLLAVPGISIDPFTLTLSPSIYLPLLKYLHPANVGCINVPSSAVGCVNVPSSAAACVLGLELG
jgi:hypothetical protein